jgi:hypothetical protein
MSIENNPQNLKDGIDIAAEAEYFKVTTNVGDVKLNSYNEIELQPKGTIFGARIKVEENGTVTPTLTFDTKKLWNKNERFDAKDTVDQALEDFWDNQNV